MIRDARAIGFNPTWYTSANIDVISKAAGATMRDVKTVRAITTAETNAYAAYVAKVRRYSGEGAATSADTFDAEYYAAATIIGEMLRMTGPRLGRSSFLSASRTISNFNAGGLIGPYTLKGRVVATGARALFPSVCCNPDNTWKSLGPPKEQF
jgi:hypothetical protein